MANREMEVREFTPSCFILPFGRGREVWALIKPARFGIQGGRYFVPLSRPESLTTLVMIDVVNQTLLEEERSKFQDALEKLAEGTGLQNPLLHACSRTIATDWPQLPREQIPQIMRAVAKLCWQF